jgi:hypothetical protein
MVLSGEHIEGPRRYHFSHELALKRVFSEDETAVTQFFLDLEEVEDLQNRLAEPHTEWTTANAERELFLARRMENFLTKLEVINPRLHQQLLDFLETTNFGIRGKVYRELNQQIKNTYDQMQLLSEYLKSLNKPIPQEGKDVVLEKLQRFKEGTEDLLDQMDDSYVRALKAAIDKNITKYIDITLNDMIENDPRLKVSLREYTSNPQKFITVIQERILANPDIQQRVATLKSITSREELAAKIPSFDDFFVFKVREIILEMYNQ